MPCPALLSGESFLASALANIDCQSRTIGAYGWSALADSGSQISVILTGLLVIFIAIFGIRLILGYPQVPRDIVTDMVKIAIVLTLATSWPAWRIIGYDLVIDGPHDISQLIGLRSGIPGAAGDLSDRLQSIDRGLASLNAFGSGRLGVAQGDWFQLGFARLVFLAGTLLPLATIRLCTGLLLALAPLIAGLLLFAVTRSVFEGWARALIASFIASTLISLLLGMELSMIEPWLLDILQRRVGEQTVLSAPVEALVLTLTFALVNVASLALAVRIAFYPITHVTAYIEARNKDFALYSRTPAIMQQPLSENISHSHAVSHMIAENFRREERISNIAHRSQGPLSTQSRSVGDSTLVRSGMAKDTLDDSWRRGARRQSSMQRIRDQNR